MSDTPKLVSPRIAVIMEDGSSHEVQTVNKDMLAWDRARARRGWPTADVAPFVFLTFLAWNALSREGQIPSMSLDEFESAALEVRPVTEDDGEVAGVDPTQPDLGGS